MKSIDAQFGRKTYALLDSCMYCGKEYEERDEWHTLCSSVKDGKTTAWLLICDTCWRSYYLFDERGNDMLKSMHEEKEETTYS